MPRPRSGLGSLGWIALAVSMLCATSAQAVLRSFDVFMDNAQSAATGNCLIGSTAQGTGTVTLDTITNELSWNLTFGNNAPDFDNGMLDQGAELVAHFHVAYPGVIGNAVLGIPNGSPKIGSFTISDAQAADVTAGKWYVNLHSAGCGPGEIRGQLVLSSPAPVPLGVGFWAAGALGLAAGATLLRRSRP